ncbi:MAG: NF038122 family metalloprotease [Pseudomonadota bacterium]|nr:NF038122 family metalloprotease [Pseudomonadota bacterium]
MNNPGFRQAVYVVSAAALIVSSVLPAHAAPRGEFRISPLYANQGPSTRSAGARPVDPGSLASQMAVVYASEHGTTCARPDTETVFALLDYSDPVPVHYLATPLGFGVTQRSIGEGSGGLRIELRGTQQLERYPLAKAAFLRAAQAWEAVVESPVTVVIDADFGPNLPGGEPWPANVLGGTFEQRVTAEGGYPAVRRALIEGADREAERAQYEALPEHSVMTDIGPFSRIDSASPVLRALGLIGAHADPAREQDELGSPPWIGFNSAHNWDFDPDDGIDPDKQDFVGTAVHEIGHALGFVSRVGELELRPWMPPSLSVWDLHRLIPGAGADFTPAPRLLTSGGEHVHYSARGEIALSTGRPDGAGGDGHQASHWKDDDLGGEFLGIMDPTQDWGVASVITDNDLNALDLMGYEIAAQPENPVLGPGPVPGGFVFTLP